MNMTWLNNLCVTINGDVARLNAAIRDGGSMPKIEWHKIPTIKLYGFAETSHVADLPLPTPFLSPFLWNIKMKHMLVCGGDLYYIQTHVVIAIQKFIGCRSNCFFDWAARHHHQRTQRYTPMRSSGTQRNATHKWIDWVQGTRNGIIWYLCLFVVKAPAPAAAVAMAAK